MLKRSEGHPNCVDAIVGGEVALVITTPLGAAAQRDGFAIRTASIEHGVPCITTLTGASAAVEAIGARAQEKEASVISLQEIHSLEG